MSRLTIYLITLLGMTLCSSAHSTNRVLFVDQSSTLPQTAVKYTEVLDALGIGYDIYDVRTQGGIDHAPLADYVDGAVVWCMPYYVLDKGDPQILAVEDYLASGGNLMFSCVQAFTNCFT
ncbi:MAG: hypothetical protein A2Z18_03425 [Armatimonadetes bacterium RBG_16_58_9]|nr:MAG: hypothetical protein A2Z18_03425 [Armatimonadetes bacterium RBG_16_58_9]